MSQQALEETAGVAAAAGEEFHVKSRVGLPIEQVRALSELSPARATGSLLLNWGAVAAFAALAVWSRGPWVIALCVIGMAAAQHGLAVLMHQAAHYRMYETRWLNELVGTLCGAPLAASMVTYRIIHRLHHNHLYTDLDPDLALMAGYPRGRWYLARKLLKDLSGLTTLKNYTYFIGKPPRKDNPDRSVVDDTSPALRAQAKRDLRRTVAIQVALLAAFVALGWWRWYLLLWLLPGMTVFQMLLRLRAVFEHGAVADTTDVLRAARTSEAPWLIRLIVFPHSMNYHVEHHLYPSVPHYRLRECHELMKAQGLLQGAEVVPRVRDLLAKVFADPKPA